MDAAVQSIEVIGFVICLVQILKTLIFQYIPDRHKPLRNVALIMASVTCGVAVNTLFYGLDMDTFREGIVLGFVASGLFGVTKEMAKTVKLA